VQILQISEPFYLLVVVVVVVDEVGTGKGLYESSSRASTLYF
jgi:hypothetical protein